MKTLYRTLIILLVVAAVTVGMYAFGSSDRGEDWLRSTLGITGGGGEGQGFGEGRGLGRGEGRLGREEGEEHTHADNDPNLLAAAGFLKTLLPMTGVIILVVLLQRGVKSVKKRKAASI